MSNYESLTNGVDGTMESDLPGRRQRLMKRFSTDAIRMHRDSHEGQVQNKRPWGTKPALSLAFHSSNPLARRSLAEIMAHQQ